MGKEGKAEFLLDLQREERIAFFAESRGGHKGKERSADREVRAGGLSVPAGIKTSKKKGEQTRGQIWKCGKSFERKRKKNRLKEMTTCHHKSIEKKGLKEGKQPAGKSREKAVKKKKGKKKKPSTSPKKKAPLGGKGQTQAKKADSGRPANAHKGVKE